MPPQNFPDNNTQSPNGTPEQQAIERLRTAVNVLVTVRNDPNVDQLAAAIGLTIFLNKIGKHATAVFSGQIPSTIEFLKPEETLEKNTDSLRDFIVSLDKNKADKLRYKVEENVVKIFITPYKTSLSEKDLDFSQGDFNVDAVVALDIQEREQLDQAILAHGRILHDATVITIITGQNTSSLGAINWQDPQSSALCEMVADLSEKLEAGQIDGQIATAYLTGIVSQTERFRNDKTTSKIMSLSAQLMAAGANQQLVADKLEQATVVAHGPAQDEGAEAVASADGSLQIMHQPGDEAKDEQPPKAEEDIQIDEHGNLVVEHDQSEPENNTEKSDAEKADPETPDSDENADKKPKSDSHADKSESNSSDKKDDLSSRHKVIQPLDERSSDQSPTEEHPFMAMASDDGEEEPSTDPLTTPKAIIKEDKSYQAVSEPVSSGEPIAVLPKIADSDAVSYESVIPPAGVMTKSPTQLVAPVADLPTVDPLLDDKTLRDIEKTIDSPHIASDPSSTLNEIEKSLKSPHLDQSAHLGEARDAVNDAILSKPYDPARPEPVQALNAASVDLNSIAPAPSSDPVLAGLGLTDNVSTSSPVSNAVLPPLPGASNTGTPVTNDNTDQNGPAAPPVPPPILPIGQ